MTDGPLIAAEAVTVRIGRNELLSGVDLALRRGEVVSLIGPNGAGKTTLIRVLLGMLKPSRGQVTRRRSLVIGYVPQRLRVDAILPLTVDRFLRIGAVGRPDLAPVLDEVGAADLRSALLHELSGGELQRVMLARALARDPDVLILDEPAQGIDFSGQIELYALIERIRDRRNCAILLVSHDLHVVMGTTDRVVCLNRHVCCSGRPEAVSRHPEYVGLFGSAAAARLAIYTHAHDHRHGLAGEIVAAAPATADGGPADPGHDAR